MVQQLVPRFILEQMAKGEDAGSFPAVSIFVDVSSFTPMATALMEYSNEGAEVIAEVLDAIFSPLIDIIYAHGGFIATFADDAFTALFPTATTALHQRQAVYCHAVSAAWQCNQFVKVHEHQQSAPLANFTLRYGSPLQMVWSTGVFGKAREQKTKVNGSSMPPIFLLERHLTAALPPTN
ncbi:MAG: hypothetical protein R2932_46910 [Caldilineaceae bacterium]